MKPFIFILFFQVGYLSLVSQNKSIRFESGQQYLDVAHHSSINQEKITIEFWLKIYDTGDPDIASGEQTILDKRGNNSGYNLRLAGTQFPLPIFTILDPGESAFIGDKVEQGYWQHIAIAVGKDTVMTYFNGALQEKKFIENFNLKSDSPLRIGQVLAYPGLDLWLRGEIDEFRIWDHVRTPEEINQFKHSELTGEENGLVLYFDFNSSTSGKILDQSTNSNHGQMVGPPLLVTSEAPVGYIPLTAPSYLLAYGIDDAIILEWKAVNEAAQYTVFRTDNPDAPLNEYEEIATVSASAQSYSDTDININTYYLYYIQAVDNEQNIGLPSNTSTSKGVQIKNYNTGVYYYPWYGPNEGGHKWEYHRGVTVPKQTPILGEHSSRNKEVISTHMRWMKEYDIDFLVSSWWGKGSWEDVTLKDFMLSEISNNERKFSIYFESPILGTVDDLIEINASNEPFLIEQFEYLADTYFNHPNYLKIDGKPAVFIYLARIYSGDYKGAFNRIRDKLKTKGFELYLVGDVDPLDDFDDAFFSGFVDAVSPYIMYRSPNPGQYPAETGFLSTASKALKNITESTKNHGIKYIPNIFPGFNDRAIGRPNNAWARNLVAGDHSQSFLEAFTKLSRPFIDDDLNMILITSWNEWHEDTQIEPVIKLQPTAEDIDNQYFSQGLLYEGYGFKPLQIVAKLLGGGITVHNIEQESDSFPFLIYPNPANDQIIVKHHSSHNNVKQIQLISMDGKVVYQSLKEKNRAQITIIPVNGLGFGQYILHITTDQHNYNRMIVVIN